MMCFGHRYKPREHQVGFINVLVWEQMLVSTCGVGGSMMPVTEQLAELNQRSV